MAKCDYCDEEVFMPYKCGYCGGTFCPKHRLPENHECEGLEEISKKSKEEGRIYRDVSENLRRKTPSNEPPKKSHEVTFEIGDWPEDRREKRKTFGFFDIIKSFFLSKATTTFLFAMILIFIGQLIAQGVLGSNYYRLGEYGTFIYYLAPSLNTVINRPWTVITSIFIHGGFSHLILNGIVLFFVGSTLEKIVGKKKFTYLFFGAGAIAAIAQIAFTNPDIVVLGASGAILGILGALTVLAPRMPVFLFFLIPMPLWVLTLGYGILSAVMAFTGLAGSIGHIAHLSGLIVGLLYGYKLREDRKKEYQQYIRRRFGSKPW